MNPYSKAAGPKDKKAVPQKGGMKGVLADHFRNKRLKKSKKR